MKKEKIKILLLEDDNSISQSYKAIWEVTSSNEIELVTIAKNEEEFFEILNSENETYNLFVLDMEIDGNSIKGLQILEKLNVKNETSKYFNKQIIILTGNVNDLKTSVFKSLRAFGARGILDKKTDLNELYEIFKKVVFDKIDHIIDSPNIREKMYDQVDYSPINKISNIFESGKQHETDKKGLTNAQMRVLPYWCAGWTNYEIAVEFTKLDNDPVKERTIEKHVKGIRDKFDPLYDKIEILLTVLTHNINHSIIEQYPDYINKIFSLWKSKINKLGEK